ncbi:Bifunctional glutamate/proline--tRNA ligase, partial [Fragariocoptes setiger]
MSTGVYADLEGAVHGEVVVRFPPEASGYLHIGHAKAALLNYHYKTIYNGKLVMRFDDTNPDKENVDYEKAILDDVRALGIEWDHFSYTSDHFDLCSEKCEKMLRDGLAYVDDTPAEQMKEEREKRIESKRRSASSEDNLKLWQEMKLGTDVGTKCCVRAKIDMNSDNGCMRDPTLYRCKDASHPRHGNKYKVYPTYDFACPIVDSVEGITHALRTSEYLDRDVQYYWILEALGMRKPKIAAYSRLNMKNTVLSKRKLTWIVDEKLVDGWDDPRMPTAQGILRRGLTVEGLKQFIIAQGSSRNVVFMEWDKIWAFNKKVIDPIVPRYTAIDEKDSVVVKLSGQIPNELDVNLHPKDPSLGSRKVRVSNQIVIEQEDAKTITENQVVTLIGLGNVKVTKVVKSESCQVASIEAESDLDNKDYKKTPKVTWISSDNTFRAQLVYYDHIITKPVLEKDEDFKAYVNRDSKKVVNALIESDLKTLERRKILQFQRKGFFICDQSYSENGMVFIYIPDGTTKKQTPDTSASEKAAAEAKKQERAEAKARQEEAKARKAEAKAKKSETNNLDQPPKQAPKETKQVSAPKGGTRITKKQTKLGVESRKEDNFADWYTEVITRGEMVEYYDVSGCYIFRPWSYAVWESIQQFLNTKIKSIGVQNCYFPMFVSSSALEKEKDHIADFAPEVAWVTKSGQSELSEPIAIRPTSETVMYPSFAKWIQSYRDLPMKLNQWNNVVRWEFKNPTPFIRTREFLWQEGHTAFATRDEACEEVSRILEFYASVYEDLLAIPVVRGRKSEKEKFPGADFTLTIEGYVGVNGRGIQAATSHHLGQNFSKMFDIGFQSPVDPTKREFVYQNSWGLSTRTIGVLVMTHGDNQGLVMPPRVSPIQAIIIPCGITASLSEDVKNNLLSACTQLEATIVQANIRCQSDLTTHNSPGWKFNHYELKGVPIRIELGPKDLKNNQFVACRRDSGEKLTLKLDGAAKAVHELLETIQSDMYSKVKAEMDAHRVQVTDWKTFNEKLNQKCTLLAPFCGRPECEDDIKKGSAREDVHDATGPLMGAKSLCIPSQQPGPVAGDAKCIHPDCTVAPRFWCLFGRSY